MPRRNKSIDVNVEEMDRGHTEEAHAYGHAHPTGLDGRGH